MKSIIYVGGTFDLPHAGHYRLLKRAHELGKVVVSLNTDQFIKDYKGSYPVLNYEERKEILLSCRWVDNVVPNSGGADSTKTIELIKPNYILVGSDWAKKDYCSQMGFTQDWLDSRGIGLVYVPYTKDISTTIIKNRINLL